MDRRLLNAEKKLEAFLPYYSPNSNMGKKIRSALNKIQLAKFGPLPKLNNRNNWNAIINEYIKNRRRISNPHTKRNY